MYDEELLMADRLALPLADDADATAASSISASLSSSIEPTFMEELSTESDPEVSFKLEKDSALNNN